MTTDRRKFLKISGGAILGGMILPPLNAQGNDLHAQPGKPPPEDDEKYWKMIRQQFPLNKARVYLNNGTMGPSPYQVIEAVNAAANEVNSDMSYGGWETAMGRLATFTGALEEEITLTHNVTEGINIVCWGLPLKKGDEVIMTTHEHVGNAAPWLNRMRLHGIVIKAFTPAATADETLQVISSLISKKTKVIAVPHIPCTQGQILPVKEISRLGKDKGLFVFIDGAHGPGMNVIDLHDMGCDFYASCSHKWMLGPQGTGFLYVRKDMREVLQPLFTGGNAVTDWNMVSKPPTLQGYVETGHRYFYGTQSLPLYRGVVAAIDFLESIGMENVQKRSHGLAKYFQDKLVQMGPRIEMLTPVEDRSRGAVIGFRIKKVPYNKFQEMASEGENNFRIRGVPENGIDCIRVSTHIYNNYNELDRLVALIDRVA
jgi:cysteine desulfurase/selenocysteine lyase